MPARQKLASMQAIWIIQLLAQLASRAVAAQAPVTGTFVSMLGNDTIAVERFTRTGEKLEGDILQRYPRVRLIHYVADMSRGRFKGMSIAARRIAPQPTAARTVSMLMTIASWTRKVDAERHGRASTPPIIT